MFDKSTGTILDYHLSMINDPVRVEAFRRAIEATIHPGDVVLDLGCGSGILSFLALRAGARRVIAVDSGEVIELARQLSHRLGFDDRIDWIQSHSRDLRLEAPADVLITETLGNGGFDEGILGTVADARRRLLRPDARILPGGLHLRVCPLEAADVSAHLDAWPRDLHGLDFSSIRPLAANQLYWKQLHTSAFLASAAALPYLDLTCCDTTSYAGRCRTTIRRPGELSALGVWFESRLTEGIVLSNAPEEGARNWRQAVLPIHPPLPVVEGDGVTLELSIQGDGSLWSWSAERGDGDDRAAEHRRHSTFLGTLLAADTVQRQAPEFRPRINDDGRVELYVLQRMDGQVSTAELAQQLLDRFPGRFATLDRAVEVVRAICRRLAD